MFVMITIHKIFLVIIVGLVSLQSLYAQSDTANCITGVVVDDKGAPLVGVAVIHSPLKYVFTDENGCFMIFINNKTEDPIKLECSLIGYEDIVVELKPEDLDIRVTMNFKENSIDEVVVNGYYTSAIKTSVGSAKVLTQKDLKDLHTTNIDKLLTGKVAGVNVVSQSGQPAQAQKIRIRGINTLTGNAEPLWVIDGVPMYSIDATLPTNSEIKANQIDNLLLEGVAGINSSDIESISILKDASAAAIYGSRAASGIIVVTTKRGRKSKPTFNYSTNIKFAKAPSDYNSGLMNSRQKLTFEQSLWNEFSAPYFAENAANTPIIGAVGLIMSAKGIYEGYTPEQQNDAINRLAKINTDWYDVIFRTGISTNHSLSVRGGSDTFQYYSSASYVYDEGILKNNSYDRWRLSNNFTLRPVDKLKIDMGVNVTRQSSKAPALNSIDPFEYAYFANPYEQVYNADGSYASDNTYFSICQYNDVRDRYKQVPDSGFNILREIDQTSSTVNNLNTHLRLNLDYKLLSNLNIEVLGACDLTNHEVKEIYPKGTKAALDNRMSIDRTKLIEYGTLLERKTESSNYLLRGQMVFRDTFKQKHSVTAIIGAEMRDENSEGLFSKRYGYNSVTGNCQTPPPATESGIGHEILQQYLNILDLSSGNIWSKQRFLSYYLSAEYIYNSKYVINTVFRSDGSSCFGSNEQFNPNGSVGFAWNIAEESFYAPLQTIANNLTIKAAVGYTGNISRQALPNIVIDYSDEYRVFEDNIYNFGSINTPPNPNLRWEKTFDGKVSLDASFLNSRINLLAEYYYKRSEDVVNLSNVLSSTGYLKQVYNSSIIDNKGVELSLNAKVIALNKFQFDAAINFAYNRNEVVEYNPPYKSMGNNNVWQGYPVGALFGGICTGVNTQDGLYNYQLREDAILSNKLDHNNSDNYRYYLGTEQAPYTAGVNLNFRYGRLRLGLSSIFSLGAKSIDYIMPPTSFRDIGNPIIEPIQSYQNDLYSYHLNSPQQAANRWTESNTQTDYPRIWNVYDKRLGFSYNNPTNKETVTGVYLQNVSYFRLTNIVLAYTLKHKMLEQLGVKEIDLSLLIDNALTITPYKGINPETPGLVYPVPQSFMFNVNLKF